MTTKARLKIERPIRTATLTGAVVMLLGTWLAAALLLSNDDERYWAQWRGPLGTGAAVEASPPLEWSEQKNVRWKVDIPGKGTSTPVVWGDRLFLTTAVGEAPAPSPPEQGRRRRGIPPAKQQLLLLAYDRNSGSEIWRKKVLEALPHEGTHPDGNFAPGSPVTDGQVVIAYFGSQGLYCYDFDGNLKWSKDLGDMRTRNSFGEGSSPTLRDNVLVVNWDHEGDSFIIALEKNTGREIWRVARDEPTSWATPLVVETAGRAQVVVNATNSVIGYDLSTGEEIWRSTGMTVNTIPSPVSADGMVYVTSGFRGSALQAIRLESARGDVAQSGALAWSYDRDTPYVPSPLLYQGRLYVLKVNSGILSAFDAKSGEKLYGPERLEGTQGVYASPVGAADRIYVVDRRGTTIVLSSGPKFEVLAVNTLDDGFDASPAVVDDALYLRGSRSLYCLSEN